MGKKVIITGATGTIGSLVLNIANTNIDIIDNQSKRYLATVELQRHTLSQGLRLVMAMLTT